MKIGRNDPCPCGSGIKYQKCCADHQKTSQQSSGTGAIMDEVREALAGQNFASIEEANAFLGQYMQQSNQAPKDDFHGLSSEQMHRFLHFPFDTPHLIDFPSRLDVVPHAPILTLFALLIDAIGDQGLKATATGNLPRSFCQGAAHAFLGEEKYRERTRLGAIRSEAEFFPLHVTRLVAGLAELIRKHKGKFILSKACRKVLAEQGIAGIYPLLFRAFVREYNWAFRDHWPEIPMIQHSFLFTLYLLKKNGAEWQSSLFYEDRFLQAFPMLLQEVQPVGEYFSPEKVLRICYSLRCLDSFAGFMGLAEIERDPANRYADHFSLRKLPLLDHVVQFHL